MSCHGMACSGHVGQGQEGAEAGTDVEGCQGCRGSQGWTWSMLKTSMGTIAQPACKVLDEMAERK